MRSRFIDIWNGDVWKIGVEIMNSENLNFSIISCDQGVGILKKIMIIITINV